MFQGTYTYPKMKSVIFGHNFIQALKEGIKSCKAQSILLLASNTLTKKTDYVDQISTALEGKLVGVCSHIAAHTPRDNVLEMTKLAREKNVDFLITLGGSSITDAAKMVSLCLANHVYETEQLSKLHPKVTIDGQVTQPKIQPPSIRAINIPTTLAAAEYSDIAACTNTTLQVKEVFGHPLMMPQTVILDPSVTLKTPEWLFLSTGIRSVDHAIETICSPQCHPMLEASCFHALSLLGPGLLAVKKNPSDLDARLKCQIGSWMSMIGVQSGVSLGASHGIGHALGGSAGVPHGYTSCVMLPHVLRYNISVNEDRQAVISKALGQSEILAADIISTLIKQLGLPGRLRDVEVNQFILRKVANDAMHDLFVHKNPRKIKDADTVYKLLKLAW
ncbi:MAG: iron-containing alcohol dehydrogenase [Legionellaceae bacterium]|nr:iron-containing alcohol dehydrogenase [Legionellaceae bacterium]